jgi:tight adherence protein B
VGGLLSSPAVLAVVAFAAMALAVVSLALLWEGFRAFRRRRSVERELRRLTGRAPAAGGGDQLGILKEEKRPLPDWLTPIANRLPRLADVQILVEQSKSGWSTGTFILLTSGLALGCGTLVLLFGFGMLTALAAAGLGAALPYLHLVRKRKARVQQFEEQFPEVIDLLARSARAGHAFQAGLQEVADEAPDPCGEEFRQVFEEQRFGLPLGESLLGLADRVDLVDVQMFVTSILIQRETGGNLAENLDNLSRLIRARFRFKRQIKVHSAHGRMTGMVLGLAPVVAGVLLYLVNPEYISLLFTEDLGRIMIAVAVFLQLVGFYVIRRMTEIEY